MTTPLSITSRNQGQIFGAKPSMVEFERQLAADPTFAAYGKICTLLGKLPPLARSLMQRLQAAKAAAVTQPNTTWANAK